MASIHTPSPKSPAAENEKSKRYDRQLRLWGENGQLALETSHVCLINANAVGTEVLKSLVLPGIRAFTIIDDHVVNENDIDCNFFLCLESSLGQPRGKVAAQYLLEMNDDVKMGDFLEENFETLLDSNINYFTNFTLVIACGISDERSVNKLSQALWNLKVPLLLVNSIGFLGYIRLQIKEHTIMEPHPDNILEDLRLDDLFPELKLYLEQYPSFDSLSRQELTRVPSLVIVYRNLLKWRQTNHKSENEIPQNYKEKTQLSSIIKEEMFLMKELKERRKVPQSEESENEIIESELNLENFEEAAKMVNKIFYDSRQVPENLRALLTDAKQVDVTGMRPANAIFWITLNALNLYLEKYGCLPVRGTIPDMNCGSEQYVQLQRIYKNKATEDVSELFKMVQSCNKVALPVTEAEIGVFARNVRNLAVVRTTPIHLELSGDPLRKLASLRLQNGTEEEGCDFDNLRFYLLMRLADRFYSKHNKYPGQSDDEVESDISELKREFKEFCNDLSCNVVIKDELIHELCRYGGCELHSISALIGGCAAQEAVKIITRQYITIDNTFVYNGLACASSTYKL